MTSNKKPAPRGMRTSYRDPDAMDIDRMTFEERKELMQKGLCFRCKKQGHRANECPLKNTAGNSNNNQGMKPNFDRFKDAPQNGKSAFAALRALTQDLDEEEKVIFAQEMANEGF